MDPDERESERSICAHVCLARQYTSEKLHCLLARLSEHTYLLRADVFTAVMHESLPVPSFHRPLC